MPINTKPTIPDNEFHIQFDHVGKTGYIKSIKVTISEDIIEMDDVVRIDLADHPLYKALQTYVKGNPR